jgi:hypothetical protein
MNMSLNKFMYAMLCMYNVHVHKYKNNYEKRY